MCLQLCVQLCDPMDGSPTGSSVLGDSPGKNAGVGCHALLQGIFPTQGLNHISWVFCIAGGFFIKGKLKQRVEKWLPESGDGSGGDGRSGQSYKFSVINVGI